MLKAGGLFLGADWYVGAKPEIFRVWDELLRSRGLNFYFVDRAAFSQAIRQSGFASTLYQDRSVSMSVLAREGLARAEGSLRHSLIDSLGEPGYEAFLDWGRERSHVLETGGMSHCHFRATK